MNHSGWLRPVYDPEELRDVVYSISDEINKLATRPAFIAVRGVSGVSVGAAVSFHASIPLVVVRKSDENTHSSGTVQGLDELHGSYVIVDDLIDSGATVRAIVNELESDCDNYNNSNEPIAVILYAPRDMQSQTGTIRLFNGSNLPIILAND